MSLLSKYLFFLNIGYLLCISFEPHWLEVKDKKFGQKRNLILINTRELSRTSSIGKSTLYIFSI